MADISNEIKKFREAAYGREVRESMISLAEKLNRVSETMERAEQTRIVAETQRNAAEKKRQLDTAKAIQDCDETVAEALKIIEEYLSMTIYTNVLDMGLLEPIDIRAVLLHMMEEQDSLAYFPIGSPAGPDVSGMPEGCPTGLVRIAFFNGICCEISFFSTFSGQEQLYNGYFNDKATKLTWKKVLTERGNRYTQIDKTTGVVMQIMDQGEFLGVTATCQETIAEFSSATAMFDEVSWYLQEDSVPMMVQRAHITASSTELCANVIIRKVASGVSLRITGICTYKGEKTTIPKGSTLMLSTVFPKA